MVRRCVIDTLAGGMSHAARQGMAHWGSQTQQLCLANTTHHRLAQRTFQRLALRPSSVHIFLQAGTIVVVHTFMSLCARTCRDTESIDRGEPASDGTDVLSVHGGRILIY